MLLKYDNKLYIRPFGNKLVEVKINKKGKEYDIVPTDKKVEITSAIEGQLHSVTNEAAYEMQNKNSFKAE